MTDTGTVFARTQDGLGLLAPIDGAGALEELTATVNAICGRIETGAEKTTLVLQLSGTPAGGREWPGDVSIQAVNRWERALRRLERLAVVNIAVARGTCGGAALDLLLTADLRIAATDLEIVLPVNDGHFWPGMSVHRLVQHLGMARARQIVLWGVTLALPKAIELGLVDQVGSDLDETVHTAMVLTGQISDQEMTVRRQLLLEAASVGHDEALGLHLAACDRELRRLRQVRSTDAVVPTAAAAP
ncbi:enoyl-CoA-hydratase DpgB [Micromonospora sp. NBC_00421]|uniref:enoyl-CoA-hydratase DpgB n=1 Tax=Micromonospora sp. NBC_00421 TaxID=2975976 RepID=UPI002E1BBCB1